MAGEFRVLLAAGAAAALDLAKLDSGGGHVALLQMRLAQIGARQGVIRLQRQSLAVIDERAVDVAELARGEAEIVQDAGILGVRRG